MPDVYESKIAKVFGFFNGSKRWAVTFGQTAYYSVPEEGVNVLWRAHEDAHKVQYAREGFIKYIIKYVWYMARYGYKNNPFEVEARQVATQSVQGGKASWQK